MKRFGCIVAALGLLVSVTGVHAQSLEERLRTQLRETRSQLQDIQGQQAQWQSQKASAEQERDQARTALAQAQAELARLRGSSTGNTAALAAAHTESQHAQEDARQARQALANVEAKVKAQDTQGATLTGQLEASQKQLGICAEKNAQLYAVGKDILGAYEHMGMGDVISAREPFAAKARVRLENAAQGYGDRLYEQRFVPGNTTTAAPGAATP
jgi:chromosome segregation ATPase